MEKPHGIGMPGTPTQGAGGGMGTVTKIALGVGAAVLLLVCCCCAALVAFALLFGEEPNLHVEMDYPGKVEEGESFDFVISMTNTGSKAIEVGDIDLDSMLSDSILDGAIVEDTDPHMERDYSIPGVKSFKYDRTIDPGETVEVVFYMTAMEPGEHGGDIAIYSGMKSNYIKAYLVITPK